MARDADLSTAAASPATNSRRGGQVVDEQCRLLSRLVQRLVIRAIVRAPK